LPHPIINAFLVSGFEVVVVVVVVGIAIIEVSIAEKTGLPAISSVY
jgi:hypothetical protein